ncbi:uncharacterized protein A1O9_12403 [Exophiala aquamarina CBS 119918]|uniref:Uncharacterized protein n=1 Tax=Exophiala aquamarina CBS 119918 TaxID=1182545 RepID=A0A072NV35_9EURO|nr:uncharacterized protein A1O9_12403 [Exophiala aquamarina CBS 119918]KEF51486.1 hypothetical protein A1O9_12403 [Exophiala aquamarina CBS 119918]
MASPELKWTHPEKRELLGGDLLAQTLSQLGVEVSFGIHGGHLDAFLIGCNLAGIKLIDTRHETTAVQAAEGYAKVSGKVGCAFVTANSGFCNSIPGLATAFADRSPVFVVTSSPPLRDAETNCLQGFHDQVVLAKPLTKFAHRVTNVEEIPRITAYAFKTAMSGIPGPVVVDFPIDVLFHPPRMSAIAYGSVMRAPAAAPGPDPASVDELVQLWKAAARPVIISGTGAARTTTRGDGATTKSPLLDLANATSTPVFYSQKYAPALPHSHPLRGGPAGSLAMLPYIGKQQPDLVLLLGARTGFLLGGRSGAIIPASSSGCKLVQVDIDGAEIGKSQPVDLGIVSDANNFISALLTKLQASSDGEGAGIGKHESWIQDISDLKSTPSPHASDPEKNASDGRLHPYHTIRAIYSSIPAGSIIILDGGEASVWASESMELARPSAGIVSTGYLGFLGNGWGYSLGAAVAAGPDTLVLNVHGDGSAGFHIQELDTYARHNLNIVTVIMNNYVWGMSIAGQDIIYGSEDPARMVSSLSEATHYEVVAQGFGCQGAIASESIDEVKTKVKELVAAKGPGLLNAVISKSPVTMVTKAMVGKTDDKNVIVVPYYDNVPRPYYRTDELKNGH